MLRRSEKAHTSCGQAGPATEIRPARGSSPALTGYGPADIIPCIRSGKAHGEVSERFKELVLKTSDIVRCRGFESHPLRQEGAPVLKNGSLFYAAASSEIVEFFEFFSSAVQRISASFAVGLN